MQSSPTKFTIKIKREKSDVTDNNSVRGQNGVKHSISPGFQDGKIGERNDITGSTFQGKQDSTLQRHAEATSSGYSSEDQEDQYCNNNAQNQLVVYNPAPVGSAGEIEAVHDLPPPFRRYSFQNQTSRLLPSVGAFTVQCANCFKWRLIPSKEKYEEIREHILEQPFVCEAAREWRPEISCEDQPDIKQDGSRLWAIDKPNIAQPPLGWERLLRIRAQGGSKFADVYYVAPSGKRLRSMVEVQRYLVEHPDEGEGVSLSQFSFQIPRPLQEDYVRKRPARPSSLVGGMPQDLEPSEVDPIAWAGPDETTNLRLGYSAPDDAPISESPNRPAKKSRMPNGHTFNGDGYMHENHQDEERKTSAN